jgi:hypothetical protein
MFVRSSDNLDREWPTPIEDHGMIVIVERARQHHLDLVISSLEH